jgi:hypothetical protein
MELIFNEMIQDFWRKITKCKTLDSYMLLLTNLETEFVEHLHKMKDEMDKSYLDDFPFLAMISDIKKVYPKALIQISERNETFRVALQILDSYSVKDQDFLRNQFLSSKYFNVIYVDFSKRNN